jgi:lactate dehydrogenase-like 2-hydroxyacid dehydrogenase
LRYARGISSDAKWIKYVGFEEAVSQADFISIHVPLIRQGESATPTYHLFNERVLKRMKPTAFLVNTSRGPVIDEPILAKALRENWIAGAALDVFEKEPLPADSPLRDPAIEDRCRLYPHVASAGKITRLSTDPNKGMAGRCVQGLMDVLEGNYGNDLTRMPFVVNKEAFRK